MTFFARVISGGQTGADVAGVRAAKALDILTGGCMPYGFRTLDGPKPEYAELYGMVEHKSSAYPPRTEQNVSDSDITLRIAANLCSAGERCTLTAIKKYKKPHANIHLKYRQPHILGYPEPSKIAEVVKTLRELRQKLGRPLILNVAGNSEQTASGIEVLAEILVASILKTCQG